MPEVTEVKNEQQETEKQEAETGFAAGFAKVRGNTPAEQKPAVEKAEAEEKQPPEKAEVKPDEWEGVPQVVKDRLTAFEKLPDRLRNIEGHIGGLTSQLKSVLAATKAATEKTGSEAPTKREIEKAAVSTEKWKQLEADFPEWTAALNERLSVIELPKVDLDSIKQELVGTVQPMIEQVRSEARGLARIDARHEGWEETVKTSEFADWLSSQPATVQLLADSNKAADAIKLLDAYKEHREAAKAADAERLKKEKRLAAAVTPQGSNQPVTAGLSDEQAFAKGFNRIRGSAQVT